ncbi:MAG: mechanosensitive ion channel family protein [Chitinophagaceae bacterium]|nr:mechanosensitive ion channel family protein [Chitinophagaceae bacterium]
MDNFLDEVWLDNTVRMYLITAGVVCLVLLVRRYFAHLVATILFQLVKAVWSSLDQRAFTTLVIRPLGSFLVILVSIITFHKLNFPSQLDVDIYRTTLKAIIHTLATIVLIVSFIRLQLRIIDFIAMILHAKADRNNDATDNQLIVFFKDFFKVLLGIVGLLMVLKFAFGYNISNLLTGLSIVGAAIALALRESLENLIASFIIFFDKPFAMGDVVKVHAFTGTVEKIGLRSTRIRTDQKTYISVPNKQMVDSIVDNLSLRTQRKGELRLELALQTSAEQLQAVVAGIRQILNRREVENSTVLLNDISSSSFNILVDYFTGPITLGDFNMVKEEINFSVLALLDAQNVDIAGASTDIRVTQADSSTTSVTSS